LDREKEHGREPGTRIEVTRTGVSPGMSFNTTDTGSLASAACDTSGYTAKNAQNEITEPINRNGKTDTTNRDNDKHEGESEGTVWKRGNRTSRNGTRSQGP
jgi:hypothetical protein